MSAGATIIAVLVVVEGVLVLAAIRYLIGGIRAAEFQKAEPFAAGSGLSLPGPRDAPLDEKHAAANS